MFKKLSQKFINSNLQAISGIDAAFLYAETPTSPMNIGGVVIIDGSLKHETFKAILNSRLHLFPKTRQRLLYVPFSIDYPYWVDDPNFDLDLHLPHVALPQPGGWKELRKLASQIFSEPLDQSRPLWSMTFVEGLDKVAQVPKGSVAIITKIHHVAVDGIGGKALLDLFLDFTPEVKDIPVPKPFKPKPLPNELALVLKSAMSFAEDPLKFPKMLSGALSATVKAGFMTRVQHHDLPTSSFSAPQTPLNGIIAARRKWNSAILSLERILILKNIMKTSMNDVMLAICAGALRRYLDEKGKLPTKSLVAMVPISTRQKDDVNSHENQISAMLVQLATNIADPIERLEAIHDNTTRSKTYNGAVGAKVLSGMADAVPFGLANQAARLYSRFHISELHNPVMNLTITNVPGPSIPLYVNGHKMLTVMGSAPIIDGMGLIITILSYDGQVTVSPIADVKSMPDLDDFTRYIRESANELETAILEKKNTIEKKSKKEKAIKPASEAIFEKLNSYLGTLDVKSKVGVFQFKVSAQNWIIDLKNHPFSAKSGLFENADTVFSIEEEHFMRIANKKLDVQAAFIQGRLKIEGNFDKGMKLAKILNEGLA